MEEGSIVRDKKSPWEGWLIEAQTSALSKLVILKINLSHQFTLYGVMPSITRLALRYMKSVSVVI